MASIGSIKVATMKAPVFKTVNFKAPSIKVPSVGKINTNISAPVARASQIKVSNKGLGMP